MKALVCVLSAFLVAGVMAQDAKSGLSHHVAKAPSVSGDVTQSEVRETCARAEKLIRTITKPSSASLATHLANSSKLASRPQIVAEFMRLYRIAEPAFKVTPAKVPVNGKVVHMSDSGAKKLLVDLIAHGAVANYGPLVCGPSNSLTVQQYGDALGFLLTRLAEMSHMPSTEYTPSLQSGS